MCTVYTIHVELLREMLADSLRKIEKMETFCSAFVFCCICFYHFFTLQCLLDLISDKVPTKTKEKNMNCIHSESLSVPLSSCKYSCGSLCLSLWL